MEDLSRRKFLIASGAAATTAAAAAAPTIVGAVAQPVAPDTGERTAAEVIEPSGAASPEPVMAYVRDAGRGEVTVMSGTQETTYRDPQLVKQLLTAAPDGGQPA